MGNCVGCRDREGQDSDAEHAEHSKEHGSRPEEFRMFMRDTAATRKAFNDVRKQMEDLVKDPSHFKSEVPRVDQYFCDGPKKGPKAATRDGKVSMEVKDLKSFDPENGSENWEKAVDTDISEFLKKPWTSVKKTRTRCKCKKLLKDTEYDGLNALELTEIEVVQEKIYAEATSAPQSMKADKYLTLALEGKPASIKKAFVKMGLDSILSGLHLKNPEGSGGSYRFNVSYPRFIHSERA